ncbi:hypothetical protein, partial [Neisseria gonorrhoeae]|uniref:hypothetical protein n=1 Tax=Neisseria gonorrhoeae TaxID=485 RepID=UPI001E375B4A
VWRQASVLPSVLLLPFAFLPPFKTVSTGLRTAFPFTSRACLIPTVRMSGLQGCEHGGPCLFNLQILPLFNLRACYLPTAFN